jgi:hypothetical protein
LLGVRFTPSDRAAGAWASQLGEPWSRRGERAQPRRPDDRGALSARRREEDAEAAARAFDRLGVLSARRRQEDAEAAVRAFERDRRGG